MKAPKICAICDSTKGVHANVFYGANVCHECCINLQNGRADVGHPGDGWYRMDHHWYYDAALRGTA